MAARATGATGATAAVMAAGSAVRTRAGTEAGTARAETERADRPDVVVTQLFADLVPAAATLLMHRVVLMSRSETETDAGRPGRTLERVVEGG